MSRTLRLSVIIPVRDQLQRSAQALAAARSSLVRFPHPWEIIVVDDASSGDIAALLPAGVVLLRNRTRLGFGPSVNRAVAAASGQFVCLLNSDMDVAGDFFSNFALHVWQDSTIAICAAIEEPDGTDGGLKWLHMGPDGPAFRFAKTSSVNEIQSVPYANGGGSFYRRRPFLELGGFANLFAPYYWEDADLGFRAWKKGYESLYVPALRLKHDRAVSIAGDGPLTVRRIKQRNRHFFHWTNFTDTSLGAILRQFVLAEAGARIREARIRRLGWLLGDLSHLPRVARRRKILARQGMVPDSVLLERLTGAA